MRLIIFLLFFIFTHVNAREYVVLAEITPPYTPIKNNGSDGIYKEILDYAFKDTKHTYVLTSLNTKSLIMAIKNNKNIDAVIGVTIYAPYYTELNKTIPIGSISLNPMTAKNFQLPLPYAHSLLSKRVGAVSEVGFDELMPYINLVTYPYAQQGLLKLFKNQVDVIVEDPLIVKCTSNFIFDNTLSDKTLYIHTPPIKSIELHIGVFERNLDFVDLINKGTNVVNVNTLKESYSKSCNITSKLIRNN
ncbi:MAG: transporter substrate-binding domain-containing protein [Methylococcales bacterium]